MPRSTILPPPMLAPAMPIERPIEREDFFEIEDATERLSFDDMPTWRVPSAADAR